MRQSDALFCVGLDVQLSCLVYAQIMPRVARLDMPGLLQRDWVSVPYL